MAISAASPGDGTGRRAARVAISADVQFRSGMRRFQAAVSDLSTHGARISVVHLMRVGDRFFLKFPTLEALEAEVVWVDHFEAGCRFSRPLHPAAFETVVRTV